MSPTKPHAPLTREALLVIHRTKLAWLRVAERQMGAAHPDIPLNLREQWAAYNRIKELEDERH
jgi:hypothetical protein